MRGSGARRHHVGKAIIGIARITKKPRFLGAQFHHFGRDGAIVAGAVVFAARDPGAKYLFAQIAARGHLQKWFDRRARQRDGKFAFMTALRRRLGCRGALPFRQAIEIALVEDQRERILIGQHVLRKLRAERRKPFANLREPCFRLRRLSGPGAPKRDMMTIERALLFGIEMQRLALAPKRIDPREQRIVQMNFGIMRRKQRSDIALDRFDRFAGVGTRKIEENAGNAAEELTERSSATIVFSKVGGAGSSAIAAISALCAAKACVKAGGKSSGLIASKGARPNGPVQSSSRGLCVSFKENPLSRDLWIYQIKPRLKARKPVIEPIDTNRLFRQIYLNLGEIQFEPTHPDGQLTDPFVGPINHATDVTQMFEN